MHEMIIIGHRGAAGVAPENSLEAFHKGVELGADILEFDVQLTRDRVPIVIHDSTLLRTHKKGHIVRWSSHSSIEEATAAGHKVATLEEVLDTFFGKILLNLEIKNRKTASIIVDFIQERYIKKPSDWHAILFSSFRPSELLTIRTMSPHAQLSLLHNRNPFVFMAYHRRLHLTGVGFHRLYINPLAVSTAKKLGLFTYSYTVNRSNVARRLLSQGIDGVVTNHPATLRADLTDLR